MVQLMQEFRKEDDIYEPVPPTPPPRAPGRQRSRTVLQPTTLRFASPLETISHRRRPKTPMSAPIVYDLTSQQNVVLPLSVPEVVEEEEEGEEDMQSPPSKEPSPLSTREGGESDNRSFDLDGFPMPPDFSVREHLPSVHESDDWVDLEDTTGKVYAFDPDHPSSDPSKDDDASDLDVPLSDDSTLRGEEPPVSRALYVYQSRYTGEGILGGSHSAALDVVFDPKRRRQSLFRWL